MKFLELYTSTPDEEVMTFALVGCAKNHMFFYMCQSVLQLTSDISVLIPDVCV